MKEETKPIIKGYKVTDKDMKCRSFQYELNKVYKHSGRVSPCESGFHYCLIAADCFDYYTFDANNRVFEIIDHGQTVIEGNKSCTNAIELIRELTWFEVLSIVNFGKDNTGFKNTGNSNTGNRNTGYSNTGDSNTGNSNTGDSNTGYRNTGNSNTGDRNTGDSNTGYWNTGNSNTGNSNTGNRNTGNRNTGNSNTGDRNTGDSNTGDSNTGNSNTGNSNTGYRNTGNRNTGNSNTGYWNTGNRNTGDSNTGYRNTGAFCTDNDPKVLLFDKEVKGMTVRQWEQHDAFRIMAEYLNPNIWIWESEMTAEEKEKYPTHKTTGGYLKSITMHEAWANMWGNLSEKNKQVFLTLPNFDAKKFKEITGLDV